MLHRLTVLVFALGFAPVRAIAYDTLGQVHPCPEGHLPGVCCFEPTPDGFVASLCGLYSRQWDAIQHVNSEEHTVLTESREAVRPRVEFRRHLGWRWLEPQAPSSCGRRVGGASDTASPTAGAGPSPAPGCPIALARALPSLTEREFQLLRPNGRGGEGTGKQEVGSCVEHGGYVWFGLAFYDSEGLTGVGGLGRFEPRTGEVQIRRPKLLRDWSSAALLHDGEWLWLATYRYAEGGDEPAIGLVRYDWARDRIVAEVDAMCGFLVTGMTKVGDDLWLASDGGLSRRRSGGAWEHFLFHVGESHAIERASCSKVYRVARTTVGAGDPFETEMRAYRSRRERQSFWPRRSPEAR